MLITSLVIGAIGLLMLVNPGASEGADIDGRRQGLKRLIAWLWGRPVGAILLALGLLVLFGAVSTMRDERSSR